MNSPLRNDRGVYRTTSLAKGVSLVELMVAMTLSMVLVIGATQVYLQSRRSYSNNDSVARLQDSARYALSLLEPDIRMSNFWGLVKGAESITSQFDQSAASNGMGGSSNNCGHNFALDLQTNIEGANNSFVLGVGRNTTSCAPLGSPLATADTLTIRRASISSTLSGTLRICSNRIDGKLVTDSSACAGAPTGQVNDLVVHSYYVSTTSAQGSTIPSLHRMTLIAGPAFRDDELVQGVEDMQVQFGIDPNNTGVATHYIDPVAAASLSGGQIVSVRVWLLVRADTPEADFLDDRTYAYGDRLTATGVTTNLNNAADAAKAYQPSLSTGTTVTDVRHYRRLLVSRTVYVRNALGT